ncbi:hypothetical protein CJF30_00010524 [Rutstroemia sp. NJR-2017a BBW]|nr:hypothetical protein CJF30_00010524 [Rutstroemia sp. NJR-2017a BBW]
MPDADPYVLTKLSEHISQHLNKSLDDAVENLSSVREAVEKALERSVGAAVETTPRESEFKFLPCRNPNFVGRTSTLSKLLSLWKPDQKSRLAVVGLGGIGYVSAHNENDGDAK